MSIAADRARFRQTNLVSSIDVLVGIFRSHQSNSEPLHLLQHAEVSIDYFSELCQSDNGFGPSGSLRPGSLNAQSAVAPPPNEPEVEEILAEASRLASEHTPETNRMVRLRDLFGGVLLTDNDASRLLGKVLGDSGFALSDVQKSYPEFLSWEPEEKSYGTFLQERHPMPRFPVAGFAADTTGIDDLIGIGPEVNAMAYLIAARSLSPPLAIGLFGDWGSGKSYFMRALRRRINRITADARNSARPQKEIDIYKYVVQIEFNAWHYVEGELWASLVEHILQNLQLGTKEKDSGGELQLRKKHWIEKLHQARLEEVDIGEIRTRLEAELSEKEEAIKQAEGKAEEKRRSLERLTTRDVWDVVKLTPDDEKEINKVINAAGLTGVRESTADFAAALAQSRDLLRRTNVVVAPLRASGWQGLFWVIAVLIVAFSGPLVSLVVSKFVSMSGLIEGFVTIGGFVSAAAAGLATANGWLQKWIKRAERAKETLDKKRAEHEETFLAKVAQLRTEQAGVLERLEQAKLEAAQKRREIRELEQELDGLTPGRVLLDFINERVGSEDYRKHLGVPALIRRDFEKLSDLINDSNSKYVQSDDGQSKAEDEHRINRIVLYIDDLDRCPPQRVVEVLQAVHLLMAFPLFVVIVAVDSRWLSQSLRSHYEELLSDSDVAHLGTRGRQATAHDYLEKIFQIPFWVRPLPEHARTRIVQGLVEQSLKRSDKDPGYQVVNRQALRPRGPQWNLEEQARPLREEAPTELRPRALEIQEVELQCMETLGALLGQTPRAVKRFVNVYRLIKATASNRSTDFVSDDAEADFRSVLFLLAVVTGLSGVSVTFFDALTRGEADTLEALVTSLHKALHRKGKHATDEEGRTLSDLTRLKAWLEDSQGHEWREYKVSQLNNWVRQVARFSYRIEPV